MQKFLLSELVLCSYFSHLLLFSIRPTGYSLNVLHERAGEWSEEQLISSTSLVLGCLGGSQNELVAVVTLGFSAYLLDRGYKVGDILLSSVHRQGSSKMWAELSVHSSHSSYKVFIDLALQWRHGIGRCQLVGNFSTWFGRAVCYLLCKIARWLCAQQMLMYTEQAVWTSLGLCFTNMHFCRVRKPHLDPTLILYGTAFPVVQEVKFLGLIFDSELTFLPHLCYLKKKCMKALNLLHVLANTSWGADQSTLLHLYRALIRSKLDYGCIV